MAKIITEEGKEKEVPDGEPIKEACKELGIPFGCEDGQCGTCMIEVEEGQENLGELNDKEKNMGMDETHRLACQCKLKSGLIKIKY